MRKFLLVFILFFATTSVFAQNSDFDTNRVHLKLSEQSGFILKDDGLTFLIGNSLIDTTKGSTRWNKIKQTDTIGKFFKLEINDNYLICLPYSLDHFSPLFIFVEITSQGEIVKYEIFNLGNYSKWNYYYKSFSKYKGLFSIEAAGGYNVGGYEYTDLYMFKELVPQDSINKIRIFEWEISYRYNFKYKIENIKYYQIYQYILALDSVTQKYTITFFYHLRRGHYHSVNGKKKSHFTISPFKKRVLIKYFYTNGNLFTKDNYKIKKLKKHMKVGFGKRIL